MGMGPRRDRFALAPNAPPGGPLRCGLGVFVGRALFPERFVVVFVVVTPEALCHRYRHAKSPGSARQGIGVVGRQHAHNNGAHDLYRNRCSRRGRICSGMGTGSPLAHGRSQRVPLQQQQQRNRKHRLPGRSNDSDPRFAQHPTAASHYSQGSFGKRLVLRRMRRLQTRRRRSAAAAESGRPDIEQPPGMGRNEFRQQNRIPSGRRL
mmetsp:Transcript_24023/g.48901  ORF Transcript_24023/g.48901 Transcript_24023/m.48901 type:complete len:207 (-) Transcript_24023:51-671(-)